MPYTRPSRGFRSPRGIRGSFRSRGTTFRGRGRGTDNYYGGSTRGSYSGSTTRGSYSGTRGSYVNTSSYRGRDDSYESRDSSSNRYSGDRGYSSTHSSRREEGGGHHHREVRESASGSTYGRGHTRHDGEPDRKRVRSEIGSSYKEGISPRRSYDDLDHSSSNRSYSSTGSPYRSSESSSFAKSHHHRPKEYSSSEFKKPLPPAQESSYSGSSSTRGSRRGIGRSATTSRISRSTVPSFLRRTAVGRISRLRPTTSRAAQQLLLRKRKQLKLMRFRRANEARGRLPSKSDKIDETTFNTSDDELLEAMEAEEEEELDLADEELDQSMVESSGKGETDESEAKKSTVVKKAKADGLSESESPKAKKDERPPMSTFHKDHITLNCVHCKIELPTFKRYVMHLSSYRHKASMESLLYDLKQKLRRMRNEQREQQRVIDEQNDDFAKTSYCRLCKLNYKQSKQEHFTSDHHINLNEFLNPRCSVCRMTFATPIMYEQHRCTLNHIKRKAFLEKKGVDVKDADNDEENNEEDNFMVLDSVGSNDEDSSDETAANTVVDVVEDDTADSKPKTAPVKKKKLPKVIGAEFIKRVPVYYCKLCRLCLPYNPNTNQEDLLLGHCRGRFHLKRYSVEKLKKTKEQSAKLKKTKLNKSSLSNGAVPESEAAEVSDSFWDEGGEEPKSSDEEEASDRYDRFGHSENIENASATNKTEPVESNEASEKVASQA